MLLLLDERSESRVRRRVALADLLAGEGMLLRLDDLPAQRELLLHKPRDWLQHLLKPVNLTAHEQLRLLRDVPRGAVRAEVFRQLHLELPVGEHVCGVSERAAGLAQARVGGLKQGQFAGESEVHPNWRLS